MASELHVDAIKHSGGTSAMTIDSSGNVHKAGFVLQVVQTTGSTGRQTYSSASYFDLVTVSITPKFATSKILVSGHTSITRTNSAYADVIITRADTQIFVPDTQAAYTACLLYTSPSPRDLSTSRMPSSA